jgi:hypothetical protein
MRFDLSTLALSPQARLAHELRVLYAGFAILFGVVAAVVGVVHYLGGAESQGWTAQSLPFLMAPTVLCAVYVFFYTQSGPGPSAVEVTDTGIRLEYKNRRSWSARWSDPRIYLRLLSADGSPSGPGLAVPFVNLTRNFPRANLVGIEVVREIVSRAEAHGLNVSQEAWPRRRGWLETLVTGSR